MNLRDSGLDVSYALRESAITEQRASFLRATENGFTVGTYQELIPQADMVLNLTPDKQHTDVVTTVQPLMKHGACLSYSHGFNIVEEGIQVREDITVIMVAPKCPGTEVREDTCVALVFRRSSLFTARMTPTVMASSCESVRGRYRWSSRRRSRVFIHC